MLLPLLRSSSRVIDARHPDLREEETLRTGKEPRDTAVCAQCGSPHDLSWCGGCRKLRFCGRDCLKTAWKWHKPECKAIQQGASKKSGSGASP